jgi:cytoskeleton protein RodZ
VSDGANGRNQTDPKADSRADSKAGAAAAAGVGPSLRARREQLGWALADVATWLRIRLSYLEAMEDGRVKDLPGNVYTVGFLRTYAQALGLDAESFVSRFKAEARDSIDYKPELSFPSPVPGSAMPVGVLALLGGVVIVIAYVGWYRMTGIESAPPQQVPSVSSAIPGMTRPDATSPQVASVLPAGRPIGPPQPLSRAERSAIVDGDTSGSPTAPAATAPAPSSMAPSSMAPNSMAPSGTAEGSAPEASVAPGNLTQGGEDAPVTAPATASQTPSEPEATPQPQVAPDTATPPALPGQMTLTASARTWVQVRVPGGPVLYDHILQPGESWAAPTDKANLLLTVGNAGGLVLSTDGVTTQPLGRNGAVVRNLSLTPDAIRSGSIVTAASALLPHPARSHGGGAGGEAGGAAAGSPATSSPSTLPQSMPPTTTSPTFQPATPSAAGTTH